MLMVQYVQVIQITRAHLQQWQSRSELQKKAFNISMYFIVQTWSISHLIEGT